MEIDIEQQRMFKAEAQRVWSSAYQEGVEGGFSTDEDTEAAVEIIYRALVKAYEVGVSDGAGADG